MKTQKRIEEIRLANTGLTAEIVLERAGQEDEDEGDRVWVAGTVQLRPRQDEKGVNNNFYLHPALRFGKRVEVFNEVLRSDWGDDRRKKKRNYLAATWAEAFQAAEIDCRAEVQKLVDALEIREKALLDAEDESVPALAKKLKKALDESNLTSNDDDE